MLILGIESSCDDTSVALLDCSDKGCFIVSEKTASQIDIHKKYGGVVPELAGRAHAEKIIPLIEEILKTSSNVILNKVNDLSVKPSDKQKDSSVPPQNDKIRPDAIAIASGPGLITGLLVGVEAARTLSYIQNIPLVAVNHIEGHIHSVEIQNTIQNTHNKIQKEINVILSETKDLSNKKQSPTKKILKQVRDDNKIIYPALALIASGGHTELINISKQGQYKLIGSTRDDAAGECFDKVAKLLGLPYPGGPQISKLAESGNPEAIKFPRPMINNKNYDFSFSGLKTSALYWLRDNRFVIPNPSQGEESLSKNIVDEGISRRYDAPRDDNKKTKTMITINDFCASFQQAITDVLVTKTIRATKEYKPKTIILGGGVSANTNLKENLRNNIEIISPDLLFLTPEIKYSMDNASMIAVAGYYKAKYKKFTDWKDIKANPNWEIK